MKHARICLLFLAANLAPATVALPILISESRGIHVGPLYLTATSPGTFGVFSETRTTSFGDSSDFSSIYANSTATQVSDITASEMNLVSTLSAGAKATFTETITSIATSTFSVTFQLMDYTTMSITGLSYGFDKGSSSSDTRLVSGSGEVFPLIWTGSLIFFGSRLNSSQLLAPGVYTLSSLDMVSITGDVPYGYDSFYKNTTVNVQFSSVPDNGSVAFLFALGLTGVGLLRRWLPMRAPRE